MHAAQYAMLRHAAMLIGIDEQDPLAGMPALDMQAYLERQMKNLGQPTEYQPRRETGFRS
jgi:hypothetical protein